MAGGQMLTLLPCRFQAFGSIITQFASDFSRSETQHDCSPLIQPDSALFWGQQTQNPTARFISSGQSDLSYLGYAQSRCSPWDFTFAHLKEAESAEEDTRLNEQFINWLLLHLFHHSERDHCDLITSLRATFQSRAKRSESAFENPHSSATGSGSARDAWNGASSAIQRLYNIIKNII